MEALADHAKSERVCQQLLPMVKAYRGWITQQPKHPISDNEQNETAKQLRAQAEACATRIENGIKLLADPLVREAFRTMNLVMARAQRQRSAFTAKVPPTQIGTAPGSRNPNWRFFQLAFVLMNLPGLAAADTPEGRLDREAVELLFFPTGGRKTEAYLGLAAFTLVHRRLRSPGIESAGITVLMRYTRRLLTLDQLGRAATLICALELERLERIEKNDPYLLGEWPFEIGMWVGKAATPTSSEDRATATSSPPMPCSPSGRPASAIGRSRSKPAPGATAPSSRKAFTCCPRGIPIDWRSTAANPDPLRPSRSSPSWARALSTRGRRCRCLRWTNRSTAVCPAS
jgi:hypothetical protein